MTIKAENKSDTNPCLQLYGQALERVFGCKYLGVILSSNLSWTPHVERIVAKTRKLIGNALQAVLPLDRP